MSRRNAFIAAFIASIACLPFAGPARAEGAAPVRHSLSQLLAAGRLPAPAPVPARAARPAFVSSDVTPPTLNSISITGAPNMTQSNPSITVTLDISDDQSGIASGTIYLLSPDGNEEFGQDFYEPGGLHAVHKEQMGYSRGGNFAVAGLGVGNFTHWSEPGMWSVAAVQISDVAGNEATYAGGQLAALGNNTFTVTNSKYDGIPPVLASGQILTPVVSLSHGNDHGVPLVKTRLSITDTGVDAASGVDYIAMYYCLPPVDANNVCTDYITTYTSLGIPSSAVSTTVTTTGVAYSWSDTPVFPIPLATPGVYQLAVVVFSTLDGISNAGWTSPLVGGTDDFGAWFPQGTTVTINP